MKLSEAILLGSTMMSAKAGGQYYSETKSGCALGMAAVARGCTYGRATKVNTRVARVNENERRTLGAEGVWGVWVLQVVARPCDCWMLRVPRKMRIKDVIAHLFDFHVMKKKNWTLEQLAGWVQTWEPKEVSPRPIADVFADREVFFPKPRVDLRQEEREWLQVREAFESRRSNQKTSRRTSPRGRA